MSMKNEYPLPHILTFKIRSLSSLGIKYLHNYYFYFISLTTATDMENLFTPQSSMNCPSITFAHFSNRILLSYQFWKNSSYMINIDGVQGMIAQNMAPWFIENFKLQEFEKWYMKEEFSEVNQKTLWPT